MYDNSGILVYDNSGSSIYPGMILTRQYPGTITSVYGMQAVQL